MARDLQHSSVLASLEQLWVQARQMWEDRCCAALAVRSEMVRFERLTGIVGTYGVRPMKLATSSSIQTVGGRTLT